jgi:hypothetical protein
MTAEHFSTRPAPQEYGEYYGRHISLVPAGNLLEILTSQVNDTLGLLHPLTDGQALFRPAPGEWSIKEVIGHILDTERIFAYRALCVARGDTTPLPGFEQDDYVKGATFDDYALVDLLNEFGLVRQTTVLLIKNLSAGAWTRSGTASNVTMSTRALACVIAGHERHHLESLRTVYLK